MYSYNKNNKNKNPFIDENTSENINTVQSLLELYSNNNISQDILCNRQMDSINSQYIPSNSVENRMMDRDSLFNMETRTSVYDPHGMNNEL